MRMIGFMKPNDIGLERLHVVIWAGPPAVACAPATVTNVSSCVSAARLTDLFKARKREDGGRSNRSLNKAPFQKGFLPSGSC